MKIACLFGRHWPEAAASPARDGHEESRCADCGAPMFKTQRSDWRAVRSVGATAARQPSFASRA